MPFLPQKSVAFVFGLVMLVQAVSTLTLTTEDHLLNPDSTNRVPNHFIAKYYDHVSHEEVEDHQRSIEADLAVRILSNPSNFTPSVTPIRIGTWRALDLRVEHDMIPDIAQSHIIQYVEQGTIKRASATSRSTTLNVETNSLGLNLGRISHGVKGYSNYAYEPFPGQGITVYIIDSGIAAEHMDFGGRVTWGKNFINGKNVDEFGHGSHVAGIVGGTRFGVAKNVKLVAVKILDSKGDGVVNDITAALAWCLADAQSKRIVATAVINMSIEGDYSQSENDVLERVVAAGLTVVVAAGNYRRDASKVSPASAPNAITVGAIDQRNDIAAWTSDFGPTVDIYAPGVAVISVSILGPTAYRAMSGTSMAAPHISGLAAYLMAKDRTLGTPALVSQRIKYLASQTKSRVIPAGGVDPGSTLIAWNGACMAAVCGKTSWM